MSHNPPLAKDVRFEFSTSFFTDYRVQFGLHQWRIAYRLLGRENWNGTHEDALLHDNFRLALHDLFEANFMYGRAVDKKTMGLIAELLRKQINQPPQDVNTLKGTVFTKMLSAEWITIKRRDLPRYRFLDDGLPLFTR